MQASQIEKLPSGDQLNLLAVRIPEACRISGIGRSKLYELIGAGEIPVIKVGAITLILVESLRQFLEARLQNSD